MSTGGAALVISIVLFLGWHAARFTRARKDAAGAKDSLAGALRKLGVERRGFALFAVITVLLVWAWLDRHH